MHKRSILLLIAILSLSFYTAGAAAAGSASARYDLVIRNGHIIDGTGSPWYSGDIAIKDRHIAAIGRLGKVSAKHTINAHGEVVAPGFIDMLGQSDLTILVDPRLPSKIYQGITTEITGEGNSVAPLNQAMIKENMPAYKHYHIKPTWRTFAGYFKRLRKQGIGINVGDYVGATSARRYVIGDADRVPTKQELAKMQSLIARAMREGALGVSTALQYAPAPYASTHELIALAKAASRYGGIYATHMRSEGNAEQAALSEVFKIARQAHIPAEIFHLKTAGQANWGKMPKVVARIDAARKSGLDIAADTYAYTAWENTFSAFIPPWAHQGGRDKLIARLKDPKTRRRIKKDMLEHTKKWDNEWHEIPGPHAVMITAVNNPKLRSLQGKRLDEIAKQWHEGPIDTIFDILIKDDAATEVAVFGMSEPDVELALRQPWISVDNDASGTSPNGLLGEEHPHPRAYATFPRIVRKFVEQKHLLSLPQAIRKFTALPAQREGLTQRGVLKKGLWADIVVFDPNKLKDVATFKHPNQLSKGMDYVLVNGVSVIEHGKMTGALSGKILHGAGYTGP